MGTTTMSISRTLLSVFLSTGLWLLAAGAVHAQDQAQIQAQPIDPEKRTQIVRLLETMHVQEVAKEMMSTVSRTMLQALRQRRPRMSEEQLAGVAKITTDVFIENFSAFNELMVHLYNKHYSVDDIAQLQQFFESSWAKS